MSYLTKPGLAASRPHSAGYFPILASLVIGLFPVLTPGMADKSLIQAPQLGRILYDQDFRQHVERARSTFMARFGIRADGRAAERAADAVAAVLSAHGRRTGQDIGDRGQE